MPEDSTHLFALWGGQPSEASPSVPLHRLRGEGGPYGQRFRDREVGSGTFPLSTQSVERGPGGEASEGQAAPEGKEVWNPLAFMPGQKAPRPTFRTPST